MKPAARFQDKVILASAWILLFLFSLYSVPSYGQLETTSASGITLLEPLHGAVFASQVAPNFKWQSTGPTQFKVQFSSNLTFPEDQTLTIPNRWTTATSLTPKAAEWKSIKDLEAIRQIVHWRVITQTAGGGTVTSNISSFFVTDNPPINNKLVTAVDMSFPGQGLSTVVSRTYLIDSTYSGPFGLRWTHAYNMFLQQYPDGLVKVFNPDGSESFFKPLVSGGYEALPGDFRTLTKNADNTFVLKGKSGLQVNFNASGKLVSIIDPNGNQISLAYGDNGLLR